MSVDAFDNCDSILESLHFEGKPMWNLKCGHVKIIGGISPFGLSLMFTEVSQRTATQYEVTLPFRATKESVAETIRANIAHKHADSLDAWDALQSRGVAL
jgi:hypothetical protein